MNKKLRGMRVFRDQRGYLYSVEFYRGWVVSVEEWKPNDNGYKRICIELCVISDHYQLAFS